MICPAALEANVLLCPTLLQHAKISGISLPSNDWIAPGTQLIPWKLQEHSHWRTIAALLNTARHHLASNTSLNFELHNRTSFLTWVGLLTLLVVLVVAFLFCGPKSLRGKKENALILPTSGHQPIMLAPAGGFNVIVRESLQFEWGVTLKRERANQSVGFSFGWPELEGGGCDRSRIIIEGVFTGQLVSLYNQAKGHSSLSVKVGDTILSVNQETNPAKFHEECRKPVVTLHLMRETSGVDITTVSKNCSSDCTTSLLRFERAGCVAEQPFQEGVRVALRAAAAVTGTPGPDMAFVEARAGAGTIYSTSGDAIAQVAPDRQGNYKLDIPGQGQFVLRGLLKQRSITVTDAKGALIATTQPRNFGHGIDTVIVSIAPGFDAGLLLCAFMAADWLQAGTRGEFPAKPWGLAVIE